MELNRHLARTMLARHPLESSRILESLDPGESGDVLITLEPERAARVLRNMVRSRAAAVVEGMAPDRGASIVSALRPDIAGHILRLMSRRSREALMAMLPDRVGNSLRPFLQFREGSAGVLMDPDVLALPRDIRVAEALQRVRQYPGAIHDVLFVVDENHALVGDVSVGTLLSASSSETVEALRRDAAHTILASSGFRTILTHPGWQHAPSLPVVDDHGVLLGVLDSRLLRRLEDEERRSGAEDETTEALGELFRAGFGALLNSVFSPSRPGGHPHRGDKS